MQGRWVRASGSEAEQPPSATVNAPPAGSALLPATGHRDTWGHHKAHNGQRKLKGIKTLSPGPQLPRQQRLDEASPRARPPRTAREPVLGASPAVLTPGTAQGFVSPQLPEQGPSGN